MTGKVQGFRSYKDGNEFGKPRSIGPIAAAEGPSGVKVLCQRHTSYYAGQARDPRSGTDFAPTENPAERERGGTFLFRSDIRYYSFYR